MLLSFSYVVVVVHEQGEQRTDTNAVGDKWDAVLSQEKYYTAYKGIPLKRIRQSLDISNTSWNGAVKGYLMS